jgi:phosphoenolpyruvate carboxylase
MFVKLVLKARNTKGDCRFFAKGICKRFRKTDKIDLMFRFIQYIERQIVLFDAIEDAAFPVVNNMEGIGSLRDIKENTKETMKRSL